MSAVAAATEHVVAMLAASSGVRSLLPNLVQEGVADERAVMPYVLIQTYGDPTDTLGNGDDRELTTVTLSVRVVDEAASLGTMRPLARAVDRALEATGGVYEEDGETWYVTSCTRRSEASMAELSAGRVIRYAGGLYELVVT